MSILNSWLRDLAAVVGGWFRDLIALIYPPVCPVCGRSLEPFEGSICTLCRISAPMTYYWNEYENPVKEKFAGMVPVEQASAMLFFVRGSGWQRLIHAFKYHHRYALARELGRWYGRLLKESGLYADVDAVVPLPLHPLKRLRRGYNQAEYIAEGIAEELALPLVRGALVRRRNTLSQARTPRRERAANVEGAFAVRDAKPLAGRHLLLVDDVLTTGSTLTAAIEALLAVLPDVRVSVAVLVASRKELGVDG